MAEDKNPEGSLPGIITCPNCGHEQTHQKSIEVFSREEDKKEVATSIDLSDGTQKQPGFFNPSPRRQGLRIIFRCEDGCNFAVAIYQHKGFTGIKYENEIGARP